MESELLFSSMYYNNDGSVKVEVINGELIFLIAWNVVILVLSVIEFKSA